MPAALLLLLLSWSCGQSQSPAATSGPGLEASVAASAAQGGAAGVATKPSGAAGARAATSGSSGAVASAATQPTKPSAAVAGHSGSSAAAAGSAVASAAGAGGATVPAQAGAPSAAAGSGGAAPAAGSLPKVTSTDGPGPFKTVVDLRSGPKGQSGLFRPDELGKDGVLHPVFVWGCGGMSMPSSYMTELTEIATHGFVVIAEVEAIGDNGAPLLAALDWVVAENERADSPFYHKLNTARVGLGGHSIGSVNSFLAGPDPRWTTTVHVAGGSLDNVNDPSAPTTGKGGKSLIHPTAYVCSESDIFGNVEKTEKDYENTTVPVFFTILEGAEHIGAVGEGLPVIIAWLRWQLADETERRGDFLDPQGMFSTGRYSTRTKNW